MAELAGGGERGEAVRILASRGGAEGGGGGTFESSGREKVTRTLDILFKEVGQ